MDQLREFLAWAGENKHGVLLLGGGSNLLVADRGFDGFVIRMQLRGSTEHVNPDGTVDVKVAAGENWDDFVADCVQKGLAGIECLSGIPGSVGASPIQNIGAYGQEVKDTITWVEALERSTGELQTFTNADMQFSYRMSRFKADGNVRYVVTSVTFRLRPGGTPSIRYGDLTRYFEAVGIGSPTLQQVRQAVLHVRGRKAMVLDEKEPNSRSCGSFFTNPLVTENQYSHVLEVVERDKLLAAGETMPAFDGGAGRKKLSAAWLMERAGLRKGMHHGNVGLSEKHVLAIVNRGGGTAAEVLELVKIVQLTVQEKFAVRLEPEPVFAGF